MNVHWPPKSMTFKNEALTNYTNVWLGYINLLTMHEHLGVYGLLSASVSGSDNIMNNFPAINWNS